MNSKQKFILLVLFVLVSVVIALFSGYFGINTGSISAFISANYTFASLAYVFLFIVLATFSFSISVMSGAGVLFFSWQEVFAYSLIGVLASSIIHFYIARKLGREYVRRYLEKKHGKIEKFDEILEKDNFKTILIFSAIVFIPPTIPNMLGGIMKINFKKYFAATLIGNLPNTFFTVYMINGLFYSRLYQVYISGFGLALTCIIALYFYKGEIKSILRISFPWMFRKKLNKEL